MERLTASSMDKDSKYVVKEMLRFRDNLQDAAESDLLKICGINYDQLDKIMEDAWEKTGFITDSKCMQEAFERFGKIMSETSSMIGFTINPAYIEVWKKMPISIIPVYYVFYYNKTIHIVIPIFNNHPFWIEKFLKIFKEIFSQISNANVNLSQHFIDHTHLGWESDPKIYSLTSFYRHCHSISIS